MSKLYALPKFVKSIMRKEIEMVNKFRLTLIIGIVLIHIFFCNLQGVLAQNAPYPPSQVIESITWDPQIIRQASGSDTWPITWAGDDNLYTAYGDGGGFGGSRKSLGFAKIVGIPTDFIGQNISSNGEQSGDGKSGKKASGMLMVDGTLYMWARNADNSGKQCQLAWSEDNAKTWTWSSWKFAEFGYCTFLNFGKNYSGARDNFVYMYSHDNPSAYTPADSFILTRVPKDQIANRASYEFFNGIDVSGNPIWTSNITQRGAVFTHQGLCARSGISYNAAIGRYLWWQQNPKNGIDTRGKGGFGVYDAPNPWGPWSTVYFTENWDVGPGETASFPSKWMSGDGKTMYLVFSGNDSFSVRKATLMLSVSDDTPPTTPQGLNDTVQSESQIDITWQAASDTESGISKYNIYRDGSYVGQSTTTSFSDTGLNEGTTYNYEVSAINGAGLESAKSTSVSATTLADTTSPTISSVSASGDSTIVTIVFSESVEEASATNASNYQINNGITVVIASLGSDLKTVTITTSSHGEDIIYTLTVNNVKDRAASPNTIAPNTTASYQYVGMNTFDADSEGWAYFDDTFRSTTSPSSADGQWDPSAGNIGGALSVALGGGTNNATSGGWAKSVTSTENDLPISFDYKLDLLGRVDIGEYGEVIVSVDGNQVGILSNDFVEQLEGNGQQVISTGWVTITVTAANVGAGSHEVIIGGYMSSKTSASNEKAVVYIDNVRISASAPIDTTPPAIPTGLTVE